MARQRTGAPTLPSPDAGVQIYDRTSILHVMVKKGQVTGVETDKGQIECQYFVNCAGQVGWQPVAQTCAPVRSLDCRSTRAAVALSSPTWGRSCQEGQEAVGH